MNLKYLRIILECGHVGAGKSIEVSRYFEDYSITHAYNCAISMPRSKKKPYSVKLVQEISIDEYHKGKLSERLNPYLNNKVKGWDAICIQ